MRRPILFLLLVSFLQAQAPSTSPAPAIRLKVDMAEAQRPSLDLAAEEVRADLAAYLATCGFTVVDRPTPDAPGTLELELAPALATFPGGTCLFGVSARLRPLAPGKDEKGWSGTYLAAQAGEAGLVYEARSVALDLAAFLLRQAGFKAPAEEIPAPAFAPTDPPARRPAPPEPQAPEVPYADVTVKVQPPPPPYPQRALDDRVEGTVEVLVSLDADGRPVRAVAASGPGELRPAALWYAMQWLFRPVKINGQPGSVKFRLPVVFHLSK